MTDKNIFFIVSGGSVIKQNIVWWNVLSKEDFDKSMPTLEIYFSSDYNGTKSPIINKSIDEIKNIILKTIQKSEEDINNENDSKNDDDKTKVKKSRYIDGCEYHHFFKITEFKQLMMKELGFKQYSSFNKKEKEIKTTPDEEVVVLKEEVVENTKKKDTKKSKSDKNIDIEVNKEDSPVKKPIKKVNKKEEVIIPEKNNSSSDEDRPVKKPIKKVNKKEEVIVPEKNNFSSDEDTPVKKPIKKVNKKEEVIIPEKNNSSDDNSDEDCKLLEHKNNKNNKKNEKSKTIAKQKKIIKAKPKSNSTSTDDEIEVVFKPTVKTIDESDSDDDCDAVDKHYTNKVCDDSD
jgi:hypothetical protein